MLKSRVLTAIVMALIALAALFGLPPNAFSALLAVIILGIGGWESATLAGLSHRAGRFTWIVLLFALGTGLIVLMHIPLAIPVMFSLASVYWLILLVWLWNSSWGQHQHGQFQPGKLMICGLILLGAFAAFSWLQFTSAWLALALLLIIAAADIGAFFTGRYFGGPKLAIRISPGKTWSGAVGGIVLSTIVCILIFWQLLELSTLAWFLLAGLAGAILAVLSIGGDLIISLMKRQRGVKDTSNLLPGHGGLMDRLDSLAAASPAFALMVWYALGPPLNSLGA